MLNEACGKFSSRSFLPSHCNNLPVCGTAAAAVVVALLCWCRCWCEQTVAAAAAAAGGWSGGVSHPSCTKRSPTGVTEAEPLPSLPPLPPGDAECFLQTLSSWGRPCFLRLCRPRGLKNKLLSLSIVPDTIEIYLTLFYDEHTNIKALSSKK